MAWWPRDQPSDSNDLVIGEELYRRWGIYIGAVAIATEVLRLVFFTARKSFTTTQVRVTCGTTAAAATPTLIENGLFTIDVAGDGTRVAVTGNDTGLYSVANSTYTRSWPAYNMVIGQRYALSWLVVSTVATPTYSGVNLITATNAEIALSPRLTGHITGQTTTPSSFTAASVGTFGARPYGVILP